MFHLSLIQVYEGGRQDDEVALEWKRTTYLELGAHIFHVNSGDTHTLYPDCLSMFPMIMNIIKHVVS